jgi:hypothetical protein
MEKQQNREISIYTYLDREAHAYDIPFHTFSDLNAVRKFKIDADKEGSIINKFTQEFDLYKLGTFDMHTGKHTIKMELLLEGTKINSLKENK